MAKRDTIRNLQRFFGIKTKQVNDQTEKKTPVPATYDSETNRHKQVKLPSEIQKYYDYWITNYDNYESLRHRRNRYRDLEFCALNSGIVGFAHELYTDESVQADENDDVVQVTAKQRKVEKYIRDFFNRLGITQTVLRAASDDLALYADHFWALSIDEEKGITEVAPISVYDVEDRLEFNSIRVGSELRKRRSSLSAASQKDDRMASLVNAIDGMSMEKDYSEWFKTYLFGFELSTGQVLPPWNIIHFRRYDTKSEFAPFGKPLFLKSIARFRQLKAMENLIAMLRAAKFPREVYNVSLDENMPETERWNKLNEAREEYYDFGGYNSGNDDELDVASPIWTAEGLINFELKEARVNLDDLGDLEQIRDDLAISTGVPRGYYDPNAGSFGDSGQALLQQYKPFARKVYHNQTAILDGLIHLVKLQFAITGDFPVDEDFELTMTFPIVEESRDKISNKSDTLRLAKDVIDNIGQAIGLDRDGTLPRDVVKKIFSKLTFLSDDEVEEWIDAVPTENEAEDESGDGSFLAQNQNSDKSRQINEANRKKVNKLKEETVRTAYFKSIQDRNMSEGLHRRRHYMTSHAVNPVYQRVYDFASGSHTEKLQEGWDIENVGHD